ncbi:MAG TPA: MarR family transcriptional regulator [Gaiellales bacterium]|nr:MarR family transcriptional regulator [Gaiellales bacterium]
MSTAKTEPPEPDPFTDDEFRVWRGFLRAHRAITDELNRRLARRHDLTLLHYGVLITLITVPERRMRMTDIAERVLTSPSGMTRAVARLEADGLVDRDQNDDDRRSFLVSLTPRGVRRLRQAQVTHHACVREMLFQGVGERDLRRLAAFFDRPA